MGALTNYYVNWSTGNDYKGASFTDGAYTSLTKTLVKANAFTASKVNHWLYLESNDGGSIVAGYYRIATWTDASTVILATDAGAGVDDDAAKCTQAAGTTALPWRSVQGALDLVTRDATNGDQINIADAAVQVNAAALTLATYGTPTEAAPLAFRGYTSSANDGGMGEIDCGGVTLWAAATYSHVLLAWLEIHSGGNNHLIGINSGVQWLVHCELHKGASSPSSKFLLNMSAGNAVIDCYIHDAGTTGGAIVGASLADSNYIYNCPTGIQNVTMVRNNIVHNCDTVGIRVGADGQTIVNNSVYTSNASTGSGIDNTSGATAHLVANNIVEGYSGAGGDSILLTPDTRVAGYNAWYNCTAAPAYGDLHIPIGGDQALAASPFTNPATGDFSVGTNVKALAFPGAWFGPAGTTNYLDIGAVQRQEPAGSSGGLIRHPGMAGGMNA